MGTLFDRMIGGGSRRRSLDDYVEFDFSGEPAKTQTEGEVQPVEVALIKNNKDLLDVKDALYAGAIVIVELGNLEGGFNNERVSDSLHAAVQDVNGDIIQKSDDTYIIGPSGVSLPREMIGS